jgi:outer membrane lipoprotein carrier protein
MLRALSFSLLVSLGLGAAFAARADFTESGSALAAPRRADVPADARSTAAAVQAFYDQTDSLEARFVQTHHHRIYARTQRSTGRIVLDKPGRLRFDYDDGKVFLSDGRHFVAYEPGDAGEPGQFVKTEVGASEVPSAFAFLTGDTRVADYRTRLLDARRYGWSGRVLELVPRARDPQMKRLVLFLDPALPGVVHRLRVEDHEGNTNQFSLRDVRYDRPVEATRFQFSPPPGSRRAG